MVFLCILIFLIFSAVALLIYKKIAPKQSTFMKHCFSMIAIVIFCLGIELSVFNINYYTSRNYEPIDLNTHLVDKENSNGSYTILSNSNMEFSEINTEIKNIKISLGAESPDTVQVTVYLTDEANAYYYKTPVRTIYKGVERSQYINVSSSGKTSHLMIVMNSDEYVFELDGISLNEPGSFNFSFARFIVLVCILWLFHIFKPSSYIYKKKLAESDDKENSLVMSFLILQCVVFIIIGTLNPAFLGITYTENGYELVPLSFKHHNQYDELAQAILEGKTYIDNNDIPQSLLDLENPYDTVARAQASQVSGDIYRWDVAFFNGHYYVYFGIVPLLLMYLPCRAIFDAPFPSAFGIIIFAFIFAVGVFRLLFLICRKYFKKISLGTYLLTSLAFINCSGAMFLVKRPDFYSVPIICGITFVIWGLYFWIKGKTAYSKQNMYLTLGSLCCALAVGCRPQCVLMCAVALPLFWNFFFKNKYILSKDGIKTLICIATPFVIVASGIMYYNNIRFGSPFDFGSSYNLTTNDVTRRGFDIGRTGLGLFTYLFQTPEFTAVFPFIKSVDIDTNYVGKTIYENCFGGLITCTPVLWFIGAIKKSAHTLKEKKLYGFSLTCLLAGVATVILNTQAGGLLQRYYSDFGYIFFLVAVLVIFSLYEQSVTEESYKNLTVLLFISTILSVIYTLCLVFSVSDVTIDTQRPEFFGYVKHLVEFWL